MGKPGANVQEQFLNRLRRERVRVTVRLLDGGTCEGLISSFDNFSLVLNDGYISHLLYKHAIALVTPQGDSTGGFRDFGAEKES
ncbi:MAG: RNA chaperone Hfq [Deltaproteobacteria bacterium]|nr:RNA chaperone Hfq [Candidatus Anaeroferrophillacea bacterium]